MKLTFPTQAEQAYEEFRSATRTISLATVARKRGAQTERLWDRTIHWFDDDTSLVVTGRGRAHRGEVLLP